MFLSCECKTSITLLEFSIVKESQSTAVNSAGNGYRLPLDDKQFDNHYFFVIVDHLKPEVDQHRGKQVGNASARTRTNRRTTREHNASVRPLGGS